MVFRLKMNYGPKMLQKTMSVNFQIRICRKSFKNTTAPEKMIKNLTRLRHFKL